MALGDRIYGCDDCQIVCPPNRLADRRSPPVRAGADAAPWVPLLDLLAASDADLMARHGRWYIPDRDPRFLRRNALVALGNIADACDPASLAMLHRYAGGADDLLAEHGSWALARLEERGAEQAGAV